LRPDTPLEGLTLEKLFEGRGLDIHEVTARLRRVALEEGLPFGHRDRTYNSRLAQELGKWAESEGRGELFHKAAFHAYFGDGINIGLMSNLVNLAIQVGLSGEKAEEALKQRAFKDAVDSDWARSREWDIVAAPTFMIGTQRVVGAQPYEMLERFLVQNHVKRRGRDARPCG